MRDYLAQYAARASDLAGRLPLADIERVIRVLLAALEGGRFIYALGNGGSAATASHFANDLGKGGRDGFPRRFKALALTDNTPLITAWANDTEYARIFAEPLRGLVSPGDVVIAISGSGRSRNVLEAARVARERGAVVVGLTGFDGGALRELCDPCVVVPSDDMQHIEDAHLQILHMVYAAIRDLYMPRQPSATS